MLRNSNFVRCGFICGPLTVKSTARRLSSSTEEQSRTEIYREAYRRDKLREVGDLSFGEWTKLYDFRIGKTDHLNPRFTRLGASMDQKAEPVDIEDIPTNRKLRKFDRIELDIEEVSSNCEGVGKHKNGMVVFVQQAHPGSRIVAEVFNRKKDFAYAKVVDVVKKSEHTIPKVCQHYPTCRGCKMQDLSYDQQTFSKKTHIENLFRDHPDVEVEAIIGNKMEFTYGIKKYNPDGPVKQDLPEDFVLGMNAPRVWDKIIEIKECHLMPEIGTEIMNFCFEETRKTKLPAYDNYAHEGFFRNLVLRFAKNAEGEQEVMVNFVTSFTDALDMLKPLAERLHEKYPEVVSVVHNMTQNKGGAAVGEQEVLLFGRSFIEQQLRGLSFRISANSFFQPNPESAEVFYEVIEKFASLTPESTVLDLFCGTGTIALSLARHCKQVHGVEVVESAVLDAEQNAKRNGVTNAKFHMINLDLTKVSPHDFDLPDADVVVLDPPRAGLHPRLIKWLKLKRPRRIVYASCNPATQVRDVDRLCEGDRPYILKRIQPVDQFPHTAHCECVVLLELKEDYTPPSPYYV